MVRSGPVGRGRTGSRFWQFWLVGSKAARALEIRRVCTGAYIGLVWFRAAPASVRLAWQSSAGVELEHCTRAKGGPKAAPGRTPSWSVLVCLG